MKWFNRIFRSWRWWESLTVQRLMYVGDVAIQKDQVVLVRRKHGEIWLVGESSPRYLGVRNLNRLFRGQVFGCSPSDAPTPAYPTVDGDDLADATVITYDPLEEGLPSRAAFSQVVLTGEMKPSSKRGEGPCPERFGFAGVVDIYFDDVEDFSDYKIEDVGTLGTLLRKSQELRDQDCTPVTCGQTRTIGFADRTGQVIYLISIYAIKRVWSGWGMPEDLVEFISWDTVKTHMGTDEGSLALFTDFSKYPVDPVEPPPPTFYRWFCQTCNHAIVLSQQVMDPNLERTRKGVCSQTTETGFCGGDWTTDGSKV